MEKGAFQMLCTIKGVFIYFILSFFRPFFFFFLVRSRRVVTRAKCHLSDPLLAVRVHVCVRHARWPDRQGAFISRLGGLA
jgi:hypothetical protein